MSAPQTPPSPRLIAPIPFKITLLDGSTDTLRVRPLDVIDLYEFIEMAAANKTPDLVCLVTGKDKAFLRLIDPKQYAKLAQKCIELNFEGAMELMADPIAASMMLPLVARMQSGMKTAAILGGELKVSASGQPPSESAAAIGIASSETPSADSKP
jgi:hypothetical protein